MDLFAFLADTGYQILLVCGLTGDRHFSQEMVVQRRVPLSRNCGLGS